MSLVEATLAVVAGDHNRRFPISDMVADRDVDDQGVIVRFADHTAQVIYTGRSEKFPIQ